MANVAKDAGQHRIVLMTSVVTRTEVLDSMLTERQRTKFRDLFLKDPFTYQMASVDIRVADASHNIRDFYHQKGKSLSTPDCHHLATAAIYEATEFHTLDKDLLPLSGLLADTYQLKISRPYCNQPNMLTAQEQALLTSENK